MHRTTDELLAGLDTVRAAPAEVGTVVLIVRRPDVDVRDEPATAALSLDDGLVGDTWRVRGSRTTPDGSADVRCQLTIMNARATELVAGDRARWSLAGDQLYLDLDISEDNLPPGARLHFGDAAAVEVSAKPHTGCAKFKERYGEEALRLVNSPEGRALRLRGLNARVIEPGPVAVGDIVTVVRRPVGPAPARSASH